jgi:hypothetical protein
VRVNLATWRRARKLWSDDTDEGCLWFTVTKVIVKWGRDPLSTLLVVGAALLKASTSCNVCDLEAILRISDSNGLFTPRR